MMEMNSNWSLKLFRCWELRLNGVQVHVSDREQRFLAAVAVAGPCPWRHLAGMLWPDKGEERSAASLRVSVHRIVHQCAELLEIDGSKLALDDRVHVDMHQVRTATSNVLRGDRDAFVAETVQCLDCSGLLPGWPEQWVLCEQGRLRSLRARALALLSEDFYSRRDYSCAAQAAGAALDLEPFMESCVASLARAHLAGGNRAMAVRVLEDFAIRLFEELGVHPSEPLVRIMTAARTLA